MNGYLIENNNNPRGWNAVAKGVFECPDIYYVVASSDTEACSLIPSKHGTRITKRFDSLEEMQKAIKVDYGTMTPEKKESALQQLTEAQEACVVVKYRLSHAT